MTRRRCCAAALVVVGGLVLPSALSAEQLTSKHRAAANSDVIKIKPNSRLQFGGIECLARATTYRYLVCFSSIGKYEVAVSNGSVVVVRARDGRVIYATP